LFALNITGQAGWTALVVSLTAVSGGPAPVLPAGPAAGENEIRQSNERNFQQKTILRRRTNNATIKQLANQRGANILIELWLGELESAQ
jgi:hypothetical protein